MSIADHFDPAPDAAFIRKYDSKTARRQFNMSIVLVGVISMAAAALAFVVRFDTPADNTVFEGRSVAVSPVTPTMPATPPAYAGHL